MITPTPPFFLPPPLHLFKQTGFRNASAPKAIRETCMWYLDFVEGLLRDGDPGLAAEVVNDFSAQLRSPTWPIDSRMDPSKWFRLNTRLSAAVRIAAQALPIKGIYEVTDPWNGSGGGSGGVARSVQDTGAAAAAASTAPSSSLGRDQSAFGERWEGDSAPLM